MKRIKLVEDKSSIPYSNEQNDLYEVDGSSYGGMIIYNGKRQVLELPEFPKVRLVKIVRPSLVTVTGSGRIGGYRLVPYLGQESSWGDDASTGTNLYTPGVYLVWSAFSQPYKEGTKIIFEEPTNLDSIAPKAVVSISYMLPSKNNKKIIKTWINTKRLKAFSRDGYNFLLLDFTSVPYALFSLDNTGTLKSLDKSTLKELVDSKNIDKVTLIFVNVVVSSSIHGTNILYLKASDLTNISLEEVGLN
jgi:hypothetical protein|nr:MAG TPA: hypothetical protein [Crassvirales sp.]